MTWKVLKRMAVIISLIGIVWFAGIGLFIVFVEFLSLQLLKGLIKSNRSNFILLYDIISI